MYAYYTLVRQFLPACRRPAARPGMPGATNGRSEPKFYWGLSPGRPHLERARACRVAGLSQREKGDSPHLGRVSAGEGGGAPNGGPNQQKPSLPASRRREESHTPPGLKTTLCYW